MVSSFPSMSDGSAACSLLDVIVFAGGNSLDLRPLSASEPKSMLRVCNRPIIWYCLAPWIEVGFRSFFLCVNEDYAALRTYLTREFSGVEFYFVLVPLMMNDHPTTSCDAVKAYLKFKESMRMGTMDDGSHSDEEGGADEKHSPSASGNAGGGGGGSGARDPLRVERAALGSLPRDALLLSCDTVLAGIDVERFVANFYSSLGSASALFFKPYIAPPPTAEELKKKGKKGPSAPTRKEFQYTYTCVAYEEEDVLAAMSACSTATTSGDKKEGYSSMMHRRLHYMYSLEDEIDESDPSRRERIPAQKPELRISMPFAARRSNLNFSADVVDAHVYLVRRWVLQFIADAAGNPDNSVDKSMLPLLARSQHSTVNANENVFVTPDVKIGHHIPTHWLHDKHGDLTVQALNAAPGAVLPPQADNLRVFCTIVEEDPSVCCKVYRINTLQNYQAANQEIVAAKCQQLRLLDEPESSSSAAAAAAGGNRRPLAAAATAVAANLLPYSSHALAQLLPDRPFTLRERAGSQQVFIVGSFVDSVPPPNVYITRSVIGPNVTLGAGARITDSILMGNVEIGCKAVIANSVIGTSAVVTAERRVTDSTVAPRCYVEQDEDGGIVE